MKRLLLMLILLSAGLSLKAQSMKMVVDAKGNVVGRYVRTNTNSFTVEVQDSYEVPKKGNRVVTFYASKGQGIVYRNQDRTGNINVRKGPSLRYPVMTQIPEFDGVPDTYPCLGKANGWYKIKIDGRVGYIRQDMAEWDGMDSF